MRCTPLFALFLVPLLTMPIESRADTPDAPVICLDPGHPSEVGRGTTGRHLSEIHAAWIIANDVAAILRSKGATVVMTKSSEMQFVTNEKRAEIANNARALLFLRLHCDGGAPGSGFAVYYPDRAGHAQGVIGPSPDVLKESKAAATIFQTTMVKELKGILPSRGLLPDTSTRVGGKQGALTGSIFAKEPAILVEMCVLTNRKDEAFLSSKTGESKMANALADAALAAVEAKNEQERLTRQHSSNLPL